MFLNYGRIKTLPSVLHIPGLARNIIFVSKMGNVGVQTIFEKDRFKMVQREMVLMRGIQCGTLYKILGRIVIDGHNNSIVPKSKSEERKVFNVSRGDTILWHQRLGHIGEKGIQSLQGKVMVEGMSNCNSYFYICEHCLYGKQNRVNFPSSTTRENEIFELIHNDMFGPVPIPSLEGYLYYISFIHELFRNTCLYFLKKKSWVFNKFKEFKALVENQRRNNIKVLRTDNGGEFCEKEFKQLCKECGIA